MSLELLLMAIRVSDAEIITEALENKFDDFDFWEFLKRIH